MTAKERLDAVAKALAYEFDDEEKETWRWLNRGLGGDRLAKFSRRRAKRWVINRVAELGWTKGRFEQFERYSSHNGGRMEHDAERMGKKYQWVAYQEYLAALAGQNFYVEGFRENPSALAGAWQLNRRDIDPTLLVRGTDRKIRHDQAWWTATLPDITRDCTFDQAQEWIRDCGDLQQDGDGLIQANPTTDQKFYVLETYHTAKQKRVDYHADSRSLSRSISTAIIRSSDYDALTASLRGKKVSGAFQNPQQYSADGFLGEYPWHPSWYPIQQFFGDDEFGGELPRRVAYHFPVRNYYCENSGYDKSIENSVSLALPSGHLIKQLELEFDRYNPSIWRSDGDIVFCDPAVETSYQASGLIDLQVFSGWLKRRGFIAVSALTEFKQFYQPRSMDEFAGELMDCQLVGYDGSSFSGERWTVLTEMGPVDTIVRQPLQIQVQYTLSSLLVSIKQTHQLLTHVLISRLLVGCNIKHPTMVLWPGHSVRLAKFDTATSLGTAIGRLNCQW